MENTEASVGKKIRMNRIFRDENPAVMIAINHGLGKGPITGLENMEQTLNEIISEHPDSLTIHKGIAMRFSQHLLNSTSLILKVTNVTKYFEPFEIPVATVEDAVKLGADAIAIGLSLGDDREQESIINTSEFIRKAEKYGIPTVAHSYPNGNLVSENERYSVKQVGYATRVAMELGIDIIKTFWTGSAESFSKIVDLGFPAKVVISGGPKTDTLRECFEMTYAGMQAGADGITYGRNVWQHEYPRAVVRGLNAIVHENKNVDEAIEIAEDCAGQKMI